MRYLIVDKKQRVETEGSEAYSLLRLKEELKKSNIASMFATYDDIEIQMNSNGIFVSVLNEDISRFTHIIFRGHNLHRPWEYETKKIIVDYIDQLNTTNPSSPTLVQNADAIKMLPYYDKLYFSKVCIENNLPIAQTTYRVNGVYSTLQTPFIVKDLTGQNDLRVVDGKEKIKKNVYLIQSNIDLGGDNLKDKDMRKYIAQEFLPNAEDFRIFVSKGVTVGGFSRRANNGFMTVNKGIYTSITEESNSDIFSLARNASSAFKADFIAVDMMKDKNGIPVIIEISLHPGFKAYETKTKGKVVNMAKIILESF